MSSLWKIMMVGSFVLGWTLLSSSSAEACPLFDSIFKKHKAEECCEDPCDSCGAPVDHCGCGAPAAHHGCGAPAIATCAAPAPASCTGCGPIAPSVAPVADCGCAEVSTCCEPAPTCCEPPKHKCFLRGLFH